MSIGGGQFYRASHTLVIRARKSIKPMRANIAPLFLIFVLLFQTACGDLTGRAVKAVSAIPSVVRVLFPNAEPAVFQDLDLAIAAFKTFVNDKTSSNWQKALDLWNNHAKQRLMRFNNARLNQIIAVVDIILSQVVVPSAMNESVDAKVQVKFNEADVKQLESLVK